MSRVFEKGDIIILDCAPQAGHEQDGRRPALVISNSVFNKFSGFVMVCPITRTKKSYPFHVELDERTKIQGTILTEQLKALDIKARNGVYIEKAPEEIVFEVDEIIKQSL